MKSIKLAANELSRQLDLCERYSERDERLIYKTLLTAWRKGRASRRQKTKPLTRKKKSK